MFEASRAAGGSPPTRGSAATRPRSPRPPVQTAPTARTTPSIERGHQTAGDAGRATVRRSWLLEWFHRCPCGRPAAIARPTAARDPGSTIAPSLESPRPAVPPATGRSPVSPRDRRLLRVSIRRASTDSAPRSRASANVPVRLVEPPAARVRAVFPKMVCRQDRAARLQRFGRWRNRHPWDDARSGDRFAWCGAHPKPAIAACDRRCRSHRRAAPIARGPAPHTLPPSGMRDICRRRTPPATARRESRVGHGTRHTAVRRRRPRSSGSHAFATHG